MKNYLKVSVHATWITVVIYVLTVFILKTYSGHNMPLPAGQIAIIIGICLVGAAISWFGMPSDESDGCAFWIPIFTTMAVLSLMAVFSFINEPTAKYMTFWQYPSFEKYLYFSLLMLLAISHVFLIVRLMINQAAPLYGEEPRLERAKVGDLFGNIMLQALAQGIIFSVIYWIMQ